MKEIAGIDMMEGMDVEKRPYPGVFRGHYKFGCYRCTKVHGRGRCPETIISINSSDNSSINTTAVGDSFHSFEGNNSINSISNNNNSLNLLGLKSDEDGIVQPFQPVIAKSQPHPHYTVTETSSPLNPGSVIRADAVIEATTTMTASILETLAAAQQPPQPQPRSPSITSKEDEGTIAEI